MSLEAKIKEAVALDGLCELIVRVSRYADLSRAIHEPAAWQAIAKYQGAVKGPWGVGIRATPEAAIEAALTYRTHQPLSGLADGSAGDDGGVFG